MTLLRIGLELIGQRTLVGQPFHADLACPNPGDLGKPVTLESLTYAQIRAEW
jgi:hypothetical protein